MRTFLVERLLRRWESLMIDGCAPLGFLFFGGPFLGGFFGELPEYPASTG